MTTNDVRADDSGLPPGDVPPRAARSPLATFARFLPLPEGGSLVTLGEGWTPLVRSTWLSERLGLPHLWFKLEQTNPTGSYKDRFAALQVSLMRSRGHTACIATSSGNTGSALAAYCARARMKCFIFLNEHTPPGKLTQMLAYGARLFRVSGFGVSTEQSATVFNELVRLSNDRGLPLVISAYQYCPDGMEGVKTISHELAAQLGELPGDVFVPVGGGGLCTAVARGLDDLLRESDGAAASPRVHAVQPSGNDTLATPWREGNDRARSVPSTTQISGLAVPNDIDATRALAAIRRTGGSAVLVDDEFVWQVQRDLCQQEGIYVEPAGATSVAGLVRAVKDHGFRSDRPVVCVLTGHGFKDPVAAERIAANAAVELIQPADIPSVVE